MFTMLCIGVGEGGGKLSQTMIEHGVNCGVINTNKQDMDALVSVSESKKLLLSVSAGGTGKEPMVIRQALKDESLRDRVKDFVSYLLASTPLFAFCKHCGGKNKITDDEAVGDRHTCSECKEQFGIIEVHKEDSVKHNYIFLFVCLGGGSGSGLIIETIDIIFKEFQLPIGVVCTLPDDNEDTITKSNAISVFKELYNTYAINGIISPLILVDNQKMMEMYNLPMATMYSSLNKAVTKSIAKFNGFSNQVSEYMSTIDSMDTARLWSLGGCCTLGKFVVGNNAKGTLNEVVVPHFLDFEGIDRAITDCTFVDGFDLSTAKGVGVIAVAPKYFLQDENVSNCIKYVFGKVKEVIGDGLIFRGQYNDESVDCLEFHIFFNGLKYPEERFARLWQDIKEGKIISQRKLNRVDEMPYETKLESTQSGQNFQRMQNLYNNNQSQKLDQPVIKQEKKPCNNCKIDPYSKRSLGVYRSGGPKPFTSKVCPVCNGTGKI